MADPRQILIIDDDPDFLDYLEIILAANGYEVQKATGADQGLALMRACCPALVIVDKGGKVYYQHHGNSMSDIPENERVLALLDELNASQV